MRQFITRLRSVSLSIAAFVLAVAAPMNALAEGTSDTTSTPTATTTPTTDATTPTPSASTTPAPTTTESAPSTTTQQPTPAPSAPQEPKTTYTYNKETEHWDTNKWYYDPATKSYQPVVQPTPVVQSPSPAPVTVVNPTSTTGQSSPTVSQTNATGSGTTNSLNETTIANALNSTALTGNADVLRNTLGGNATTGNASAATTILNNVNSTVTNADNQKAASFVTDVMGDVNGDIVLQPMLLKAMLEAGASGTGGSSSVTNTSQLTNDINLNATSGNATVGSNTTAGNATTGSANTVANVMNIINSMVTANRSFVGTVNIYGNLNGDILIAPDFIPQLLASNAAAPTIAVPTSALPTTSMNDTQSIVNNVALAAKSGKAAVTGNTSAGNATTGSATTNVVLFNLSGHQVVASNSLLVFVNVLGKWVGVIVDAPSGATAAAIGNGVTSNTTLAPDMVVTATNTAQVTNNINLSSQSGDALVTNNTTAGNATSGSATASANIGNIVGSQLGLSDWFGVLFINVFGTWHGSFGVDTPYGNRVTVVPSKNSDPRAKTPLRVIDFIPRTTSTGLSHLTPALTVIDTNNDPTNQMAAATPVFGKGPLLPGSSAAKATAMAASAGSLRATDMQPVDVSQELLARLPLLSGAAFLTLLSLLGLKRTLLDGDDRSRIA